MAFGQRQQNFGPTFYDKLKCHIIIVSQFGIR